MQTKGAGPKQGAGAYIVVQDQREHAGEIPVAHSFRMHHRRHQVLPCSNINDGGEALLRGQASKTSAIWSLWPSAGFEWPCAHASDVMLHLLLRLLTC